jgi:hypothetical protein
MLAADAQNTFSGSTWRRSAGVAADRLFYENTESKRRDLRVRGFVSTGTRDGHAFLAGLMIDLFVRTQSDRHSERCLARVARTRSSCQERWY